MSQGMIKSLLTQMTYLLATRLFAWLALLCRNNAAENAEYPPSAPTNHRSRAHVAGPGIALAALTRLLPRPAWAPARHPTHPWSGSGGSGEGKGGCAPSTVASAAPAATADACACRPDCDYG